MGVRFAATIRDNATTGLNALPTAVITRSPLYVAALTQATTITTGQSTLTSQSPRLLTLSPAGDSLSHTDR